MLTGRKDFEGKIQTGLAASERLKAAAVSIRPTRIIRSQPL
jgi:hypothetical protein